ncbi:MAG: Crp/Fnr family transcriptional regulator [Bacteroidales bacterium]|nr:Crp/Fnr family transcriptional regulator [Bacteroidales bacterium]
MNLKCECEKCELKNAFFNSFDEFELQTFCTQKVERKFSKGETFIKEGEKIEEFIYLKSGLVKLHKTDSLEKDQIITIAEPFDFVSLLSVFSDKAYNYSVTAIEDSVICCLQLEDVKKYARSNGLFSLNLIEKMSLATDKIILESLEIRNRHLRGKVAFILLKFSQKIYQRNIFELPVSRREIAEYIGMTTENVIRTLSEFRKDKLIKINGKEIEIVDEKTLSQISSFG